MMIRPCISENIIKNDNYFDDLHIIAAFHKTFPDDAGTGKQIQSCKVGRYSLEMILSGKTALKLDQTVLTLESPCVFWIGDHHSTFEFILHTAADIHPEEEKNDPHGIALLARQIKSEPFKKYDTERMAEKVGVSSVHFRMLFRQKTGKSLHQYILEQQMLTAGELLKNGQFRIGELADYCNYPDIGTFSRAFKRYYKISPRQWLETHYGEKNGSGKKEGF